MSLVKLHLGCGKRDFGQDWIHVDQEDFPHVDIKCGVTDVRLDAYEGKCDLIYASHVLEYFDRQEAASALSYWWELLKPGGVLRLAVPDFEAMANLYVGGHFPLQSFLGPLYGRMESDGKLIYHKTTWDYESLEEALWKAGFSFVCTWNWRDTEHADIDDHSQAYLPHMDKIKGTLISLNIEATK